MSERVNEDGIGELRAGTMLGKYSVVRRIGAGAMGAVYEGTRNGSGVRVAIKVLDPKLAAVAPARERFLAEARIAERVRHPNIVEVTEAGDDGGRPFLVMELLGGEDLAQRLERSRPIPAAEAADILIPVCGAIAAAHQAGVTHRDLKPHNIFLAAGEPSVPKVLDFGIALADGVQLPSEAKKGSAGAGKVVGSPYYVAPEQVATSGAAGPASDQYALAVIAYECLTGQRPFDGETLDAVLTAIASGVPRAPSALRPELPAGLDAVVLRAMSRAPSERFASVTELGRALLPFASPPVRAAWEGTFAAGDTRPAAPANGERPNGTPFTELQAPRQRTLTSPAIEVEAAQQSPFARTLPPEEPDLSEPDDPDLAPLAPPLGRRLGHQPWQQPESVVPRLTASWPSGDSLSSILSSKWARLGGGAAVVAIIAVVFLATRGDSEPAPAVSAPTWIPSGGSRPEATPPAKPAPTPAKPAFAGADVPPPKYVPGADVPPAKTGPAAVASAPVLPADETAPAVSAVPPPEPAPPVADVAPKPEPAVVAAPPAPPIKPAPPAVDLAPPKPEPAVVAAPPAPPIKPAPPAPSPATEKVRARPASGGDDDAETGTAKSERRPPRDSDAATKRRVPLLD